MEEPPPPSYDDAITGNFSPPPPPPSSSPPISVTTSFLGPERYKAPESIVPFPSPPLAAATSLPPSPGHERENLRPNPDLERQAMQALARNRSPSPNLQNQTSNQQSKTKKKCIQAASAVIFVLVAMGVLYFVLSPDKEEDFDSSYDWEPKVIRTTTTTTPRPYQPPGPDDCKALPNALQPPKVDEKKGSWIMDNDCKKNYHGWHPNGSKCRFKCNGSYILSSSKSFLDVGYDGKYEKEMIFTCVDSQQGGVWQGKDNSAKDGTLECLTLADFMKQSIG